jgi:translation initiation factor IF-2
MAEVTVTQLAETTNTTVERLLQQLKEAGLSQTDASDLISEEEKQALLAHIKSTHGETEAEAAPKKITLKRRTLSTLKTGGSSGRGRTVNVEVRKKRTYVRKAESEAAESPEEAPKTAAPAAASAPAAEPEVSAEELAAEQAKAKEEALRRAAHDELLGEANRRRDEAAKKAAEEEQKAKEEAEKKAQDAAAEQARKAAEDKKKDTEESRVSSRKDKRDRRDLDDKDSREKRSRQGGRKQRIEELSFGDQDELLADETGGEKTLGLSQSRPRKVARPVRQRFQAPTEEQTREVEIGENITVAQLSQRMSVKATDVIKTLMSLGVMANINQTVDQDTATLVVEEFGHTVKLLDADAVETALGVEMELDGESVTRAPVVTVMGHVDHGKTSLLDYIRNSRVATGEAGGITQHIGAYRVPTKQGEICFIDTPGHAAFTAMRARGANSTDIVILVVAADDGVMPQTEEAIQHAKNAGAPMVVAINKIDKEGADPDRAKNGLAAKDVIPEDWGGDTQFIPVSALTGQGIDDLLEAVLLQAELMELKAVEEGPANGVVVESELDKGKGPVATLLVQNGTLKQGDIIVAGQQFGRARAITGDDGKPVKLAGPSTPVSMLGLDGPPSAGDTFTVVKDEKRAREVALFRKEKADSERLATPAASLDNLLASFGDTKVNYLNVVVKADVKGSLEAIVSALNEIGNDEVKVNVVYSGVGGIAEHDVNFAITSGAVIFGFNVRADSAARKLVERDGLDLRYYKVIYDLVDDVRDALTGMLAPELREEIVGIAEVRDVFQSKKLGAIAGCMVIEGTVYRDKKIRVLRDNIVIFEGELESLRHFKDEVESARNGTECGIGVKSYNDVKVGDQIEVFDSREIAREL